jgi:hypothetical protein
MHLPRAFDVVVFVPKRLRKSAGRLRRSALHVATARMIPFWTVEAVPRVSALVMYATHLRIPLPPALALLAHSWLKAAAPIAPRWELQSRPGARPDGGVTVARLPLRNAPMGPRAANEAAAASAKKATAANANDLTALLKAAPFRTDVGFGFYRSGRTTRASLIRASLIRMSE